MGAVLPGLATHTLHKAAVRAVVTGGASGLGFATARLLAAKGGALFPRLCLLCLLRDPVLCGPPLLNMCGPVVLASKLLSSCRCNYRMHSFSDVRPCAVLGYTGKVVIVDLPDSDGTCLSRASTHAFHVPRCLSLFHNQSDVVHRASVCCSTGALLRVPWNEA